MIVKIGNYRVRFYISKVEKRVGICSRKYDNPDSHMLLWDFDKVDLILLINELRSLQLLYGLPTIYIIESSKGHYHAYCFTARTMQETIGILAGTKYLDVTYLRLGIIRSYFTLRISPRKNEKMKLVCILPSIIENEMLPLDMTTNEYYTSNRGGHNV